MTLPPAVRRALGVRSPKINHAGVMASFIREAILDDAADLARLIFPLGYPITDEDVRDRWQDWSAQGNSALVTVERGASIGVVVLHRAVVLHRPKPVGRITSVAVDSSARGRGFGRALIEEAEAAFARKGCGWVEVTSHVRRAEAHEFSNTSGTSKRATDSRRTSTPDQVVQLLDCEDRTEMQRPYEAATHPKRGRRRTN